MLRRFDPNASGSPAPLVGQRKSLSGRQSLGDIVNVPSELPRCLVYDQVPEAPSILQWLFALCHISH